MSSDPVSTLAHRTVRSYVLRSGRVTDAQRRALAELWPRFGVQYRAEPLDLPLLFGRDAPRVVEIGFGNGELLVAMAGDAPDQDFVGIEVHESGIGHCLLELARRELRNVRLIRHDAVEVLQNQFPSASLARVQLMFPDPWPKKRHHKRRIVQTPFLAQVARVLQPGGEFHVATDWPPYAEHIAATLAQAPDFEAVAAPLPGRLPTRFERRGQRLGHPVWDGHFRTKCCSTAARPEL
jgi:tRNA (guanine-N7-)-methyltransferase